LEKIKVKLGHYQALDETSADPGGRDGTRHGHDGSAVSARTAGRVGPGRM